MLRLLLVVLVGLLAAPLPAASYRTRNFLVTLAGDDGALARQFANLCERYRSQHAENWQGRPLPPWEQPCQVEVQLVPPEGEYACWARQEQLDPTQPVVYRIHLQATYAELLRESTAHEVGHVVFFSLNQGYVARWLEEGLAQLSEPSLSQEQDSEQARQQLRRHRRRLRLGELLQRARAPSTNERLDRHLYYAQAYWLAKLLVERGGRAELLRFAQATQGTAPPDWAALFQEHYGYADLVAVERDLWRRLEQR